MKFASVASRFSLRRLSLLYTVISCAFHAGVIHTQDLQQEPPPTTDVLRTGTQLVELDVLVQDAKGQAIHGLPRDAFHVEESKTAQRLRSFEEHSSADAPRAGPTAPKLPPGVFTDYTPVPAIGPLNVLLIDALNTPLTDQSYLRDQLKSFVDHAPGGQQIAIFGLSRRLYILQGFTSNVETLKEAMDHKLVPHSSSLLDDPTGSNMDPMSGPDTVALLGQGSEELVANLQQFEAEQQASQLQLRAQYTLDAMNALAHYLGNFAGRKNLIWFSGSFPINVLPDPSVGNGFRTLHLNEDEFRETTNLLAKSQVAVYPVDARGIRTQPMYDAAGSGRKYVGSPTALGKDLTRFEMSEGAEHTTMDQMAGDTGGHAYYGTNGLAEAVSSAVASGSNYYTLTYTPTNRNPHGEYRDIRVTLSGAAAAEGLTLSYRRGYYADDPARTRSAEQAATTGGADPRAQAAASYTRAALTYGSPMPEDILYQVSVLPEGAVAENEVAPGNQTDPQVPLHGPFRRFAVNFAAVPSDFAFEPQPNGHRLLHAAFKAYVFDRDGKLLVSMGKESRLDLTPAAYERIMAAGIGMHLDVSTPAKGDFVLRLAVQDLQANKIGVVEVSTRRALQAADVKQQTPAAAPTHQP